MSKKHLHDQKYYLKLVARCLEEIKKTPQDQGLRFLYLKNKAKKYLAKAREFEPPTNQVNK